MSALSAKEPPIFVSYVHYGDRYSYLDSGTPVERKPLRAGEIWIDYDNIPATPPLPSPFPGTAVPLVTGILNEPLFQDPGNPLLFRTAPPNRLSQVLPGNIRSQAYRPVLLDALGQAVPYDPSVWVADGVESVLAFKYNAPAELGHTPPLTLTYWVYTGAISGTSLALLSLTNEGAGTGLVFDATIAGIAQLRTLQADPAAGSEGLAISTPALPGDVIQIGNTLTGANLGAGTGTIFSAKSGAALQFNSLAGTANGLAVSAPAAGVVTIDNTLTGANLGAGAQVFEGKTGASLRFRSLVAGVGSGLTATQGADEITLDAAAGSVVSLANEGAGPGLVFDAVVGNTAQLRTLQADPSAGSGGLVITTPVVPGNEVHIGNTLTGANIGAGTGTLFNAKSGASLQFNSLAGTANGLAVSAPAAGVVTIDNTLTGANLGAGAQVFEGKTGASLRFRSLVAGVGSGLTVAQGADEITLDAAAGSVVSLANEGAGPGLVFDTVVGNTAQLRTLQADPAAGSGGLAITTPVVPGNEIRIGNTLTGANLGAGTGTLFSAKSGATLQFNSLAGTANGLAVSAPAAGVVTIDNTLTGANLGAGSQVFESKVGASLRLRSLAAGANVTLTQNANDISFAVAGGAALANLTTWRIVDQKATGTNAGASVVGVQTRTLNTIASSGPLPGNVTLGLLNTVKFLPGRYVVRGSAPNRGGNGHSTYLVDDTTGVTVIRGTSSLNTGANAVTASVFAGFIDIAVSTTYRISQFVTIARAVDGLGAAVGQAGQVEVYTELTVIHIG